MDHDDALAAVDAMGRVALVRRWMAACRNEDPLALAEADALGLEIPR